ncbi:hypothetical protein M441DRAFT_62993 [Trichoderma asperellum CBS 433.97]|uniref:Uncharacterized protein n=1 Tax=Trichoderma asperellum (strain ATCC 204424 / CBS 433.97 / NBRC 101777) TaxID=1042311 RepID=A0A2T3YRI0_TRIA4|nr:hypothetical protein M441DRAFT_62993 [Trichoderma asperellum CBS 433.97]PTB35134.1 hypothetical protein M441DRAFT_62993 [Trichoderma asperellum CBS 433.97]
MKGSISPIALHRDACNGLVEIVKFLLAKHCAESDSKNKYSGLPLQVTTGNGQTEILIDKWHKKVAELLWATECKQNFSC